MSKIFLFSKAIEIGTKVSTLDVYKYSGHNSETVYECIIDKEETFEIAKGHQGEWYDYESGNITNISELLGNLINEKVAE